MSVFIAIFCALVALNTNFSVVTLQQSSDDLVIGDDITLLLISLTGSFNEVIKNPTSKTVKEVLGNDTTIVNKLAKILNENVSSSKFNFFVFLIFKVFNFYAELDVPLFELTFTSLAQTFTKGEEVPNIIFGFLAGEDAYSVKKCLQNFVNALTALIESITKNKSSFKEETIKKLTAPIIVLIQNINNLLASSYDTSYYNNEMQFF